MSKYTSGEIKLWCMTMLLLPVFGLWSAYVTTKLWAWFVVATFGAKEITIPVAYGLQVLLTYASGNFTRVHGVDKIESITDSAGKAIGYGLITPSVILLVGYIIKWFM